MTGPQLGRPRDGIREVADGVMMITRAVTNSYLVTTDDGILLIDAGLPRSWSLLTHALTALRATPDDLVSVLLTTDTSTTSAPSTACSESIASPFTSIRPMRRSCGIRIATTASRRAGCIRLRIRAASRTWRA